VIDNCGHLLDPVADCVQTLIARRRACVFW
jgi:hypothetical protein